MKLLALIAAVGLYFTTGFAGSATSSSTVGRISVTETLRDSVQPSPGLDGYRFTVYDQTGQPIGYQTLACFRVAVETTLRQCSSTLVLPLGKVTMTGTVFNTFGFSLAVTGGTDSYTGAAGVFSTRKISPSRWAVTVVLS